MEPSIFLLLTTVQLKKKLNINICINLITQFSVTITKNVNSNI